MIKRLFVTVTFTVLVGLILFGCSSEKESASIDREKREEYAPYGGYSFVYVLGESDFVSLKEDLESGKNAVRCIEKYTPVTELKVGERYYAVGYTYAETKGGSERGSGFYFSDEKDGEILSTDILSSGGSIEIDKFKPEVAQNGTSPESNGYIYYSVAIPKLSMKHKVEACSYVSFMPRNDMRINITYGVNATALDSDMYEDGYTDEITLDAVYEKRVDLLDIKVSYLEGGDYVDGKYDKSDLKSADEINMKVSETYYMVVNGKLMPHFSEKRFGNSVSLKIAFPLASRVSATLDTASSGTYTEETNEEKNKKTISVEIKLPDNAEEEKEFTVIIRLVPQFALDVYVDLAFFSPSGISVIGKDRVVDAVFKVQNTD